MENAEENIFVSITGYSSEKLVCGKSFEIAQQIICGENCTFVLHANGAVSACGEGSNGRLGLGNSDDYDTLTLLSALRGKHPEGDNKKCQNIRTSFEHEI